MKNIINIIVILFLLSGCSGVEIESKTEESNIDLEITSSGPKITYSDDFFIIYSFSDGSNSLDLNFNGTDDYIFVSHITGADYYDYHINANRDIYSFFINYANPESPNSWNIITKEVSDKKIIDFDRDFVITEPMGCNGGRVLRIVQTKDETFLIIAGKNPGEKDGADIRVMFDIYKLKSSGKLRGSDYIFSFIDSIVGESRGCGIEKLANKDISNIIQEIISSP